MKMNKLWYDLEWNVTQTQKRYKLLIHATIWINLKNIMLSKRSQKKKKRTDCIIHLFEIV